MDYLAVVIEAAAFTRPSITFRTTVVASLDTASVVESLRYEPFLKNLGLSGGPVGTCLDRLPYSAGQIGSSSPSFRAFRCH